MEQERNDLHSGSAVDSLGMDKAFVFNCPHLGTLEDSDTSLAYPASANHCFRVDSPTGVDLSHQEEYCLTDRHPGCHVFQMASTATADVKPAAPLTAPGKRKQRVSFYALPLILILILLAAIIWWPAPGTTIQESLVLGAQNDREVSGGATLNGKPVSQPPVAEEAVEVTSPTAVPDPAPRVSLNESGDRAGEGESDTSTAETAENSTTGDTQDQASSGPDMAAAPDQPAGTTRLTDTNTETAAAAAPSTGVEAPVEMQPSERETSTASSASTSSSAENASNDAEEISQASVSEEDTDESTAVIIIDLPVISTDVPAVTTAPEAPETTNAPSGLVTLVGPAVSTSLTLRDSAEDVNVLPVYQGPAGDSELLSLIDHKQFVTLLGRDSGGNWLKVRLDTGVEGWIDAVQSEAAVTVNSLPVEDGAIASEPTVEQPKPAILSYPVVRSASVDTGALNVRSGPGLQYESIAVIGSGDIVGLIGRRARGPWVRIRLDSDLEGWVNSSLLAKAS